MITGVRIHLTRTRDPEAVALDREAVGRTGEGPRLPPSGIVAVSCDSTICYKQMPVNGLQAATTSSAGVLLI